jgi:hypothetical protein
MFSNRFLFAEGAVQQDLHAPTFRAIPRNGHLQPVHGEPNPHLSQIHLERVETAFGDYYSACSCGARSLPCTYEEDAKAWACPIREAEAEAARNRRLWEQRVLDASCWGRVR